MTGHPSSTLSRGFHFATRGYNTEVTDGGCRATEVCDDLRPDTLERLAAAVA